MIRNFVHPILDVGAAASLGAAVWFALSSAFQLPPVPAAGCGMLVFALVAGGLARLGHRVPPTNALTLNPLEFIEEEEEVLLLDRPIEVKAHSPVVRLLKPIPTPGELHQTIERHLQGERPHERNDAEKLSEALAQLRSAIR